MRYNRSLFTVYSFITRHLFQFCTKNFHLRPKQVFPPFLLSLFSYFCFKIKYHLILTKNENNLSLHWIIRKLGFSCAWAAMPQRANPMKG